MAMRLLATVINCHFAVNGSPDGSVVLSYMSKYPYPEWCNDNQLTIAERHVVDAQLAIVRLIQCIPMVLTILGVVLMLAVTESWSYGILVMVGVVVVWRWSTMVLPSIQMDTQHDQRFEQFTSNLRLFMNHYRFLEREQRLHQVHEQVKSCQADLRLDTARVFGNNMSRLSQYHFIVKFCELCLVGLLFMGMSMNSTLTIFIGWQLILWSDWIRILVDSVRSLRRALRHMRGLSRFMQQTQQVVIQRPRAHSQWPSLSTAQREAVHRLINGMNIMPTVCLDMVIDYMGTRQETALAVQFDKFEYESLRYVDQPMNVNFQRPRQIALTGVTCKIDTTIAPGELVFLTVDRQIRATEWHMYSEIFGLYEHTLSLCSGRVMLDDKPIGELDRDWIRNQIHVFAARQQPMIHGYSIAQMVYFRQDITDEEVAHLQRLCQTYHLPIASLRTIVTTTVHMEDVELLSMCHRLDRTRLLVMIPDPFGNRRTWIGQFVSQIGRQRNGSFCPTVIVFGHKTDAELRRVCDREISAF